MFGGNTVKDSLGDLNLDGAFNLSAKNISFARFKSIGMTDAGIIIYAWDMAGG